MYVWWLPRSLIGVAELLKLRLRMLIEQREDIEQMDALQIIRYGCTAKITQLHKEVWIFSSFNAQYRTTLPQELFPAISWHRKSPRQSRNMRTTSIFAAGSFPNSSRAYTSRSRCSSVGRWLWWRATRRSTRKRKRSPANLQHPKKGAVRVVNSCLKELACSSQRVSQ